jgi:hypothetical protein
LKLSKEAFGKASEYIKKSGQKIDIALFEYYFEDGPREKVLEEIKEYGNEDGGFGKGIEPDFNLALSSPMGTTIAFQYFRKVNATSDSEIVQKGITYFINTFDENKKIWHAVPQEVNNEPHAPWWHYNEKDGRCAVEHCFANPSAEILGYLHEYSDLVPVDFLNMMTKIAIEELLSKPDNLEMHEMLCYIRMCEKLSCNEKEIVLNKLRKSVRNTVELNPSNWEGYGAKPLSIVDSPDSPLIDLVKEEIELNLDYEIGKQNTEGFWAPNWAWGQYEDAWEFAREKWSGRITVENLIKFKKFNRIEIS